MAEVIIAVIGLIGTVLVAAVGLYGAKKYNIGPNQDKLVDILQDTVDAQEQRITQLEEQAKASDLRVLSLSNEVDRLTKLTVTQLVKIQDLEIQLEKERRDRVPFN